MAPPRRTGGTRGRTRRKVRKNIAVGQAHIKTSFNNTHVALTDREGNVIAWKSAGAAGFKGSRKSTPFAAQVTADLAAREGMEHGLQKVEVFVKGPGVGPRHGDPLAPGRRSRDRHRQGRHPAGPQRLSPAQAAARLGASGHGPLHRPEVQAVPPGGHEALPEGRALPDREVRHRAPLRTRPASTAAGARSSPSTSRSCARSRRRSGTTACSRSSSARTTRRPRARPASRVRTCCASSSAVSTTSSIVSASLPPVRRAASSCATATSS